MTDPAPSLAPPLPRLSPGDGPPEAAPRAPWLAGLLTGSGARKTLLLVLLVAAWELYARRLENPLLVPTASATARALVEAIASGELAARLAVSLRLLLLGYGAGVVVAAALTILAASTRLGADLLDVLTAMLNPLPAVALLPIALLWFGIGAGSIVFVLLHAVVWPVALNAHAGFSAVSPTLRMVGRSYGLRGPAFALRILVPAALPHLLTGLKVGWAFAWRTLIAAELVFGVSSGRGGIGWFIYERKNQLEMPGVFAGLTAVVAVGLLVEHGLFRPVETRTVRRWGMRS